MENRQILERVLQVLNEAYAADPVATRSLLCFTLPINKELANHPTIQCREFEGGFVLTPLGFLNGISTTDEVICTKWSEERNSFGERTFLGFDITKVVYSDE